MRRLVALAVVLSLAWVGVSSAVPHADDCHAEVCAGVAGPHDPEAHRVGPAAADDTHQHCAVCHWVRALREDSGSSQTLAAPAARTVRGHVVSATPPPARSVARPPLRAPPHTS